MLLACTKKFADALKTKPVDAAPFRCDPLYEWHAHLFFYKRRKGIIIMNNQTRYSIMLYGVMARQLKNFAQIVLSAIQKTWIAEGFSEDVVTRYIEHCGDIVVSKTFDRSVLGQINDVIYLLPYHMDEWLYNGDLVLVEASRALGQTPMLNLPEMLPIDSLRKELLKAYSVIPLGVRK